MFKKSRWKFRPEFKAQVGLEALKGIEPIHAIAARHEVHPVQVSQWKKEMLERLPQVFATKAPREQAIKRLEKRSCIKKSASSRWNSIG